MLKSELDLNALNAYLKDGPNTQQKIFRKLKVGIERVVVRYFIDVFQSPSPLSLV